MDRRTRNLFLLALVVLVAATGGAALLLSGSGGAGSGRSVVGLIVGVESEGLDRVRAFDLRTEEGQTIVFAIGTLENGTEFPPGHLVEHQATAQRVRVWYVIEGATSVAIRLEDAP